MPARRQIISSLTAFIIGSAGCTTRLGNSDSTATSTHTDSGEVYADCTEVGSWQMARRSDGTPPIRSSVYEPDFGWTSTEWLVTTNSEREALSYSTSADGIKSTKQYIEKTNLSKHTILIWQFDYDECVTFEPRRISWSMGKANGYNIQMRFEDVERDSECDLANPEFVQASVLRIPNRITKINSFGWSTFKNSKCSE
jgi:hypothetical protein